MAGYHRVIGIDLGTTYSVVAAYNFDKQDVLVIPNRQNERTTPSVVYVSPKREVVVGKSAKKKLSNDPAGVVFEVKRMMGENKPGAGKSMAAAAGQEFDPEFISAHILKELKACAEKMIGAPVHDAVITVPAYFRESQKNATREAAKLARLNPRLIMNEPTAAAVAYGLESGERQTFVVYDLGGGTFDVSVVRIENEKTVEVLGTGGNARLGGGDIDQKITDWILRKMKEEHGKDFTNDGKLVGKLRLLAEEVKVDLSNQWADQEISVDDFGSYTLTVPEFEEMIRPLLTRTVQEVEVALKSAKDQHGLELDDIDAFILVGGSSKIPAVGKLLSEKYKKEIKSNLNPDEIVAMGAARMALNYDPSLAAEILDNVPLAIDKSASVPEGMSNTNIKDVVSHTMGVGLVDDVYDPLIPKDHVIPHKVVRGGYTTAKDNQTTIQVPVYQGDHAQASSNTKLGEVVIDGLTPEKQGAHRFEITFALNADGIFQGEIKHLQTGKVTPIKLKREGGYSEKKRVDLAEMVSQGTIQPRPAPADPVAQLVLSAHEVLPSLPAGKQREVLDLIAKLTQARARDDHEALGHAVSMLTTIVKQSRS
jgi:molecular chaperone DnaK